MIGFGVNLGLFGVAIGVEGLGPLGIAVDAGEGDFDVVIAGGEAEVIGVAPFVIGEAGGATRGDVGGSGEPVVDALEEFQFEEAIRQLVVSNVDALISVGIDGATTGDRSVGQAEVDAHGTEGAGREQSEDEISLLLIGLELDFCGGGTGGDAGVVGGRRLVWMAGGAVDIHTEKKGAAGKIGKGKFAIGPCFWPIGVFGNGRKVGVGVDEFEFEVGGGGAIGTLDDAGDAGVGEGAEVTEAAAVGWHFDGVGFLEGVAGGLEGNGVCTRSDVIAVVGTVGVGFQRDGASGACERDGCIGNAAPLIRGPGFQCERTGNVVTKDGSGEVRLEIAAKPGTEIGDVGFGVLRRPGVSTHGEVEAVGGAFGMDEEAAADYRCSSAEPEVDADVGFVGTQAGERLFDFELIPGAGKVRVLVIVGILIRSDGGADEGNVDLLRELAEGRARRRDAVEFGCLCNRGEGEEGEADLGNHWLLRAGHAGGGSGGGAHADFV